MSAKYPRVSLFNTEDRRVHSTIVGREYQVAVSLPHLSPMRRRHCAFLENHNER